MVELDRKSIEVLIAIQQNNGVANTSEIRSQTGLKNNIIHYRYDKLKDLGLIETEPGKDDSSSGLPPTVARLTEQGEQELEEGLLSGTELPPETVEDLKERIDRLETRLDQLEPSGPENVAETIEDRVRMLEGRMDSTWELLGALREYIEDRDGVDLEEEYFD